MRTECEELDKLVGGKLALEIFAYFLLLFLCVLGMFWAFGAEAKMTMSNEMKATGEGLIEVEFSGDMDQVEITKDPDNFMIQRAHESKDYVIDSVHVIGDPGISNVSLLKVRGETEYLLSDYIRIYSKIDGTNDDYPLIMNITQNGTILFAPWPPLNQTNNRMVDKIRLPGESANIYVNPYAQEILIVHNEVLATQLNWKVEREKMSIWLKKLISAS